MNWHYVSAGQAVGPISDADLEQLVKSGTIQAETLVWNETMSAWQPFSTVRPGFVPSASPTTASGLGGQPNLAGTPMSAPLSPAADEVICAECRNAFNRSDAINLGNAWVCAACKPIFVQRMKEGAFLGLNAPTDPDEFVRLIQERGYTIDIGSCLGRSWELLKANFWMLVGATLLSQVIQQAAGLIPILGVLIFFALSGILQGGLYNFYVKLIRGQSGGIADIFSGFGPRWGQLMLVPIIQVLIIGVFVLGAVLVVFAGMPFHRKAAPNPLLLLIIPVVMVPLFYLGVSWFFSLPLVIDRGLNFWPAMELSRKVISRHWWTFFAMMIVAGCLVLAGVLACFVGVFVAVPLVTGMFMYAYDDIFGSGRALGS